MSRFILGVACGVGAVLGVAVYLAVLADREDQEAADRSEEATA